MDLQSETALWFPRQHPAWEGADTNFFAVSLIFSYDAINSYNSDLGRVCNHSLSR